MMESAYITLITLALGVITPAVAADANITNANALAQRISPRLSSHIRFEVISQEGGKDVYEMASQGDKLVIRGNSGVAMASGLYHYLKEFCHCHISRNGNNLSLPTPLPRVDTKIRQVSPVSHRFAYNYCTHGYTMVWWNWAQWEKEIDWLALHGINMALLIQGQDAVWQNAFTQFGYTQEEMRKWLCSPAHQPWQFMQNMQGVMSPPQTIIDKRLKLGQKIVQRCRELGVQPVLQGYYGMLPSGFKAKHPNANILSQGGWAGGNKRPDMLNPGDPMFATLAKTFYSEQKKLFGDCDFFAADPFHEGGKTHGVDRGVVFRQVQDAMLAFEPNATLVKQCWQASNKEMFAAGKKEQTLALDLYCDYKPFWKKCNGYDGTPWIWSAIQNFGGNVGMEGNLPRLVKDVGEVLTSPKRGKHSGFALTPEGSETDPVVYELLTEMGWRGAPEDLNSWVEDYILARYGRANPSASKAWEIMLDSNYKLGSVQAPANSVICASPRINKALRGRRWSVATISYDNRQMLKAWENMLEASRDLGQVDTFRFDLADVTRQTLSNLSRPIYNNMVAAYQAKNITELSKHSQALLGLIRDLDELTATRQEWLMGRWVADARRGGDSAADKAYLDRCARMLLTTWVENPNTNLKDYANREWSGLLKGYYLPRWQLFVKTLTNSLTADEKPNWKEFDSKQGKIDVKWIASQSELPSVTQGDTVAVSRRLYEKYKKQVADI